MTKCPFCFTPGAYDSGFRIECLSPSCEHYSKRWAVENGYGGRTEPSAVPKEPQSRDFISKYPNLDRHPSWTGEPADALRTNSHYGKEPLLVPKESLPPPGSERRILTTPVASIPPGATQRFMAMPQMAVQIDAVLVVTDTPGALVHLVEFRIGCESVLVASNSPISSALLAKTPLEVHQRAGCAVNVIFDIQNASCAPVQAQGVCLLGSGEKTSYVDTDLAATAHENGVLEERERIAKMLDASNWTVTRAGSPRREEVLLTERWDASPTRSRCSAADTSDRLARSPTPERSPTFTTRTRVLTRASSSCAKARVVASPKFPGEQSRDPFSFLTRARPSERSNDRASSSASRRPIRTGRPSGASPSAAGLW